MRTTIRSESTFVPPVTAERSPPLSRMTGADSPVIADSSTEAMPSMISPSPGISCPASTTTTSPLRSDEAGTSCVAARRRAGGRSVSWRIRRSASAWALPRPSAIASAKFANSTVNQSQTVTLAVNQSGAPEPPPNRSRSSTSVVSTLPTSTTNMTGFFATWRGASLRKLSSAAGCEERRVEAARAVARVEAAISVHLSGRREEVLDDRAEARAPGRTSARRRSR